MEFLRGNAFKLTKSYEIQTFIEGVREIKNFLFGFGIENFDINFDHTMLFFAKCGHIITEEDFNEETRSHELREILQNCFSSNIENSVSEFSTIRT